jgi:hypothetical protein
MLAPDPAPPGSTGEVATTVLRAAEHPTGHRDEDGRRDGLGSHHEEDQQAGQPEEESGDDPGERAERGREEEPVEFDHRSASIEVRHVQDRGRDGASIIAARNEGAG